MKNETLYRRPLPDDNIAFSSSEGKTVFAEALAAGGMNGYFPLAEQFHTQAEPAYCGLGSLVVALNALAIDPGRLWKGPWRWFHEELLDCCVPLVEVRARGLDLDEVACLARCNGAMATLARAESSDIGHFREALLRAASGEQVLVAAYDRAALGQTGSGHFSPIGGYHAARDLVLVLDVARFKYPPHWVRVDRLWSAMLPIDAATGKSRGWIELRAREQGISLGFVLRCADGSWTKVAQRLRETTSGLAPHASVPALAEAIVPIADLVEMRVPSTATHRDALAAARAELRAWPAFPTIEATVGAERAEAVAMLLLAANVVVDAPAEGPLAAELSNLGAQIQALSRTLDA